MEGGAIPQMKKIQNYTFKLNDVLGKGNFSKVYRGRHQLTNQIVAVKVIELNSLKSAKLEQLLFSEIDVLKKLNHPNVLKCYHVFSSNRNCYIITQLCNEGDLETKLRAKRHYSEQEAEKFIADVFKGLLYLSQNHVIHRDLKVANIFLHDNTAKIADFGFAKFTKTNFKDINIGSPIYMSPEGLLHNVYGPKTDVWAFGVFIYELLHGRTPFSHCQSESQLHHEIKSPITYSSLKSELSFEIKDLILKCLQINEDTRLSFQQLSQNQYIKSLLRKQDKRPSYLNVEPDNARRNGSSQRYQNNQMPLPRHYSIEKNRNSVQSFHGNELRKIERMASTFNKNSPLRFKELNNELQNSCNEDMWLLGSPINLDRQNPSGKLVSRPQSDEKRIKIRDFQVASPIKYTGLQNRPFNRKCNHIIPQSQNDSVSTQPTCILSTSLKFKEAVNVLHYCRLLYKYLTLLNILKIESTASTSVTSSQSDSRRKFIVWLFKILKEITQKLNNKQILYDNEQSEKQGKFKQVSAEYYRKYLSQLEFNPSSFNWNENVTPEDFLQKIKQTIKNNENSIYTHCEPLRIQVSHFLLVIYQATNLLRKCSRSKNFYEWGEYSYIQEFISTNKKNLTYNNYIEIKARILT